MATPDIRQSEPRVEIIRPFMHQVEEFQPEIKILSSPEPDDDTLGKNAKHPAIRALVSGRLLFSEKFRFSHPAPVLLDDFAC
jgi:hypothetical protein